MFRRYWGLAVVATLAGLTRADAQRAIGTGRVLVDGEVRPKSFRLEGGERLAVDAAAALDLEPWPDGPEVPIRFEDDHVAVVAKPAGIATHPTASKRTGTLVNRLLAMDLPLADVGDPLRPGIVHRLDAGTSGLLIIAKDQAAFEARIYEKGSVLWRKRVSYSELLQKGLPKLEQEEALRALMEKTVVTVQAAIAKGKLE